MSTNYIREIKAILEAGRWTQKELARRLGVTVAALNRWIHGHAKPHPAKRIAIARLYQEMVGFPAITPEKVREQLRIASRFRSVGLWGRIATTQNIQEELILEHTYNSSVIEGSTFTKKETEAVIFDKSVIHHKSLIEHLEVTNHAALFRDILIKKIDEPVSEKLIQEFHGRLLQGIRLDAGEYSQHQRAIRGVDMVLTHPKDIPEEMAGLIKDWQKNKGHKEPLSDISDFHVRFELIHPFGDGNGRVGRLIMALQCLQSGLPPVVIENSRKAEYYDVLEYAQRKDAGPFKLFICSEMERTHRMIQKFIS